VFGELRRFQDEAEESGDSLLNFGCSFFFCQWWSCFSGKAEKGGKMPNKQAPRESGTRKRERQEPPAEKAKKYASWTNQWASLTKARERAKSPIGPLREIYFFS
jgi:hypothetical protein